MTLSLAALGGEMSGELARWLWKHTSRTGRLDLRLQRLRATGSVDVHRVGPIDQRILRLTNEGVRKARGGLDPESLWKRPWDRVWRIVAFDVPEAETARRTRLRRRLHEFRFGWLQNSVWISPDPLDAFRAGVGGAGINAESLTFFEARPAGGESHEGLVSAAWDFERIGRSYADYLALLRLRPSRPAGTVAAWLRWLETEHRAWRCIARRDPFLPAALLPPGYRGQVAWASRQEAFADFACALTTASGLTAT